MTIGVFGDWGGGKSTLIQLARQRLDEQEGVLILTFNGWLFEGYEDAKAALMGTILDSIEDALQGTARWTDALRDRVRRMAQRVDWLQALGMTMRYGGPIALTGDPRAGIVGLGFDALKQVREWITSGQQPDLEQFQKLLKEAPDGEGNARRTIRDFRRDFRVLLADAGIKTLVVFIDDLDRCLPDTVIETLEAIKLFLFVPGTAFVVGADEYLIQYAVRQRFPELPGTAAEVGRDYLEKLIQIPVRVPPLNRADIESYMNLLLAQHRLSEEHYASVCADIAIVRPEEPGTLTFGAGRAATILGASIEDSQRRELDEDCAFTASIVPVLLPGLAGNPRRAKRFLNALLLRLDLASRRGLTLQRGILAKLMLLEYIKPEFFRALAGWQLAEAGRPAALFAAEQSVRVPPPSAAPAAPAENVPGNPDTPAATASAAEPPRRADKRTAKVSEGAEAAEVTRPAIPAEILPWLADDWAREWLALDPLLSGVDLRPYFFIAHDLLDPVVSGAARLSPPANEVLQRLLDPNRLRQGLGLDRATELSLPDANAVFQALTERLRRTERIDATSVQPVLLQLVERRHELLPQLVQFYEQLPEVKISLDLSPNLARIAHETPSEPAIRGLLARWTNSASARLKAAATAALGQLERPARRA